MTTQHVGAGAAGADKATVELERLNKVALAINGLGTAGQAPVSEILGLLAEGAAQLIPGASVAACVYDPAQGAPDTAARVEAGPAGRPFGGDGAEAAQRLCERAAVERDLVLSYEMASPGEGAVPGQPSAAFPLLAAGQVQGVLYVALPVARRFTDLEPLLLHNLANQAAMAIHRVGELAGMQRDLARKQDELARLHHAGLLISSRHRLDETLEAILTMALEVTDAHYGVFRLVDRASGHLVTKAIAGDGLGRPHTEPLPIGATSIMGYVAASRRPLRISDLRQEPWAHIYYPLGQELTMRSELAVPLIGADGRLEGVLNLESPAVDAFSEADSYLLQALATQAVVAIEQVSLLDALQEITERLLTQPYPQVLRRLSELASRLLNNGASAVWSQRGGKLVLETTAVTSEWDQKVMAILNRYAALALENANRQDALRLAREQQAVAETFAALGDIAANLLHKLNNKVGTIPVRVEGIQDKYPGILDANPYLAANLADIERSAREAMQAVRESLALLHPLHREPLDLAGCVGEAITAAHLPAGVQVSLQGLAALPRALANEHSLTLVIVNLLTNAADAMGGKGKVTIAGSAVEGAVLLSVSDTGPGIPPELHERVFELHFSARKSTSPHKLGFGLWWVKTLMARLDGAIAVESDGRHGATFRLRLPCEATAP